MKFQILFLTFFIFSLISCSETKTDNPKLAYEYWSGQKPKENLNIEFAEYWRSAHWSYEYKFSMKFKPSKNWWDDFIKTNNLKKDMESPSNFENPPSFFNPTKSSIQYKPDDNVSKSRYYRDTITGICYIYEIQL